MNEDLVTEKYLRDHLDSKNYVTKEYLDKQNFVTKEYLESKNYVTEEYLDSILEKHTARFERYVSALSEDFQSKLKGVSDLVLMNTEKLERHDKKFEDMDRRFDQISGQLYWIQSQLAEQK